LFEYAKEIGIDCHVGVYVDEYFEEKGKAGIIVQGKRLEADLLIAAVCLRRNQYNSRME
jgi:hypothetical protein